MGGICMSKKDINNNETNLERGIDGNVIQGDDGKFYSVEKRFVF